MPKSIASYEFALAQLGYNVCALDSYGEGIRLAVKPSGRHPGRQMPKQPRPAAPAPPQVGLAGLQKPALTDPSRVAGGGYCFGGTTHLRQA